MERAETDLPASEPGLRMFTYTVSEKAPLYVAIVDALTAAKERFLLQVRPDEIRRELAATLGDGLRLDVADITACLEQLADWGNLARSYDTAAPETLVEFYAKRYLYQLTPAGVAAHEGVAAVRASRLDAGGRLSAVLLPAIVERLEAIKAQTAAPDAAKLYGLLGDLFASFADLAENSARYMSDLARSIGEIAAEDATFLAYKQAVFAYLNDFVGRFTDAEPAIRRLVSELDPDMDRLVAVAAAADAAPTLGGTDAGPVEELIDRWGGVCAWFLGRGEDAPVSHALRASMLDALRRILVAVSHVNERHMRRVTREADFTQLAGWFAAMDGSDASAAHTLWDTVFGMWPARHFSDAAGDEEAERGRSFWDAAAAEVPPRLRQSGRRASPGRPGFAADYSDHKLARLEALRHQHAQATEALLRLAGRMPVRLSDLGDLDAHEFAQFLAVIDAALNSTARTDGERHASTPLVSVRLRPPADRARATVSTAEGSLDCPDYHLDIAVAAAPASRREQAG